MAWLHAVEWAANEMGQTILKLYMHRKHIAHPCVWPMALLCSMVTIGEDDALTSIQKKKVP
jgi:hypothetical protein